ncbi:branched-chain amino acid ABC transporter (permease) [Microbacterium sp. Root61]|uniref:branched-chain amino acid ABC transporter permease n=1 Tax=Microbacterium sp. Root61 TaxID=1736570 RepID=UPI0006F96FE4|nr:branched-chain amino acid ABC transporter permease [Microbacterium sp. Root61]KRA24675.1 branched-chain amino acid ABC transporter (permease) [Microbacterium sp. Root61]
MQQFIQSILLPGLSQGAIYGLIAVAFAVLHKTTGVLNFAHGQLVVLAPIVILMATGAGVPVFLAFVIGIVVLVAVALVTEYVAIRPFVQSGSAVSWILSTFGVSVVLAELLAIPSGGEATYFPFGIPSTPFDLMGFRVSWAELLTLPVLLALAAVLMIFYRRTRVGRELRAIGEDVQGAEALGISRARASQITVLISVLLAAVTGYMVASSQILMPSLGMFYMFYGFVAVSMGGMNSVGGAVIGGLIVGLVSQASTVYIGPLYGNLAVFALLILVYVFKPYGIFGARAVREV